MNRGGTRMAKAGDDPRFAPRTLGHGEAIGAAGAEAGVNMMAAAVVGLRGALAGKRLAIGSRPITFGRSHENDVILTSPSASRIHAELRHEAGGYVLHDRGSSNGTWVDGRPVTVCQLRSGDEIVMGDETFRFGTADTQTTIHMPSIRANGHVAPPASASVLRWKARIS